MENATIDFSLSATDHFSLSSSVPVDTQLSAGEEEKPSTPSPDDEKLCDLYTFVVCAVVIGIVCAFGLAGNVLSFLVLCKHKTENAAIFLLQCMAVLDFLLLVATLFIYTFPAVYPYTNHLYVMHASYSDYIVFVWPVGTMLHTATVWLTVLVTVNRYNAVCRAIEEFGATSLRSTKIQVAFVIVLSVLYSVPRFFEHRVIRVISSDNSSSSIEDYNTSLASAAAAANESIAAVESASTDAEEIALGDNRVYQIIYSNLLYYPVMYILPLGSLAYLNFKLITSLKAFKQKALSSATASRRNKDDNITRCVIAIVCVFIVTQTPALLNQIFWATFAADDRNCGRFHFYYTKLSDLLVVVNSSCNFVVYVLFGRTFRQIFLDTIRCRGRREGQGRVGEKTDKTRYSHVASVPLGPMQVANGTGRPTLG